MVLIRPNTAPCPAAPRTPYGTSTPLRVPKAPAESPPGPAGSKGSIGMQWGERGPLRMGHAASANSDPRPVISTRQISDPLRRERARALWRSTQKRSVPLASASLGLGSRRPLDGLFKSGPAACCIGSVVLPSNVMPLMTVLMMTPRRMNSRIVSTTSV